MAPGQVFRVPVLRTGPWVPAAPLTSKPGACPAHHRSWTGSETGWHLPAPGGSGMGTLPSQQLLTSTSRNPAACKCRLARTKRPSRSLLLVLKWGNSQSRTASLQEGGDGLLCWPLGAGVTGAGLGDLATHLLAPGGSGRPSAGWARCGAAKSFSGKNWPSVSSSTSASGEGCVQVRADWPDPRHRGAGGEWWGRVRSPHPAPSRTA